jgi:hypothetical protein
MYSLVKILLLSSLLFAVPALAGTTTMNNQNVVAGSSNDFPAKASSPVTVSGTIVPQGEKCLELVPSVVFQLERHKSGAGSQKKYALVETQTVELTGSLTVSFTAQSDARGVYRVTWRPNPIASGVKCKFYQSLDVTYSQ